jgi:hypothetical protein
MSEMFDGIDTETLRTLHRQIGDKAITVYTDATAAHGTSRYHEIMSYGRQLADAADLISTELKIRHEITMADLDRQIAALHAAPARLADDA